MQQEQSSSSSLFLAPILHHLQSAPAGGVTVSSVNLMTIGADLTRSNESTERQISKGYIVAPAVRITQHFLHEKGKLIFLF